MVALLASVPPLLAAALFIADAALPGDLVAALVTSLLLYIVLSAAVLVAVLAAAWGRRDSAVLASAWLFLFCGMMLLSLSELTELLGRGGGLASDLFEAAAFFPLLIFAAYVAAPLRILVVGRRRSVLYAALGVALVLAVAALTLAPWLRPGAGTHGAGRLLRWAKPELDALLLMPLAVLLLALGAVQRARPYLFVGLGLLVMIPADLFSQYHLTSGLAIDEELAAVLSLVSQLYVLIGAAACAAGGCKSEAWRERAPVGGVQ